MAAIPLTMEDVARDIQLVQVPKWLKKLEEALMRQTFLYRRLQQKGRVVKDPGGYELIWNIKIRLPNVEGFDNHQGMDFAPTSKEIQCRLGYRNLRAGDAMSIVDQWINQGPTAFRRLVNDKARDLRGAMNIEMESGVYRDGEASGNLQKPHGIETGMGAGAVTTNDRIAAPNGTYAQQSTVLGNNGGYWSALRGTPNNASLANDWPDGYGDTDYDCNSPKLVNTNTLAWGTGSTQHGDNLYRAISQTMVWLTMTGGKDGAPDLCPTDSGSYQRLRENQEAKLRLQSPVPSATDLGLPGYAGSVHLDGMAIYPDFYCPVDTSYMLNSDQIELNSRLPGGDLFMSKGPIEIPHMTFSSIWAILASLNYKFASMKHFAKIAKLAS